MNTHSNESFKADRLAKYGRRIGWYAIIRAVKPHNVVETGVDKGLGSCVIVSALMKNAEEGHKGHYTGTDINPQAGYLLAPPYSEYGNILYGDSIDSLRKLNLDTIDVFINDSDHSADYEYEEYNTIRYKLHKGSIIIGDNSHLTSRLQEFALENNRRFLFFQENPKDHWTKGAGIGVCF